jgi:purine-cytosine permease-like protein
MLTVGGFCVIASSIGGQCLATVNPDKISKEVGIVIVVIPAIFIAFGGYKILHVYQRWAWIPTLIFLCITIGYGGKGLRAQATPDAPSGPTVINTIALWAGYMISWGNVVGDYCVYMPANAPRYYFIYSNCLRQLLTFSRWRLFFYCLLGLCIPLVCLLTFGAAIGGAILNNPTWLAGYHKTSTGGVLGAMLEPVGGGKFILVMLAFSVVGTCAREIYTISVDFQVLIPKADKIPRFIWVLVTGGAIIGVAIGAVEHFYTALTSFLDFIGYWSASYVAIIMLEFMYFRKNDTSSYDISIWDSPRKLPPGIAAAAAALIPWALVVPSMDETWYTGSIAKVTGDLGNEFAGILSIVLYIPLQTLEIKWRKGLN